ncbi:hypothetical protein H6P81_011265 [Aristolochia fimbriata]|uniref:ZF-HD dimerization-type domain-containing protein n=1 Tax=Aristolochia fimbriata TaxID=158543 RepID=A0AAV7ET82_ARIFI|nr:hypothetical protein H6P81_011265 [Aristolochia fimbriata]
MKKYQQRRSEEESQRSSAASPYNHSKGRAVRYGECQKNHAAKIGGFAVDGCREFMASLGATGELKCAACGCHRNFHRREIEVEDCSDCSSPTTNVKQWEYERGVGEVYPAWMKPSLVTVIRWKPAMNWDRCQIKQEQNETQLF